MTALPFSLNKFYNITLIYIVLCMQEFKKWLKNKYFVLYLFYLYTKCLCILWVINLYLRRWNLNENKVNLLNVFKSWFWIYRRSSHNFCRHENPELKLNKSHAIAPSFLFFKINSFWNLLLSRTFHKRMPTASRSQKRIHERCLEHIELYLLVMCQK